MNSSRTNFLQVIKTYSLILLREVVGSVSLFKNFFSSLWKTRKHKKFIFFLMNCRLDDRFSKVTSWKFSMQTEYVKLHCLHRGTAFFSFFNFSFIIFEKIWISFRLSRDTTRKAVDAYRIEINWVIRSMGAIEPEDE